jgi:hypothetical protein
MFGLQMRLAVPGRSVVWTKLCLCLNRYFGNHSYSFDFQWVFVTCIWELLSSVATNRAGWSIGNALDLWFFRCSVRISAGTSSILTMISSVLPGKFQDHTSVRLRSVPLKSFTVILNSLFIYHPAFRLCSVVRWCWLQLLTSRLILILKAYWYRLGACGSIVDWGTVLEAERSRVRFPMRSLDFSID